MVRERIADDIYVFTSKTYAQVTAGAILTQDGVALIDTLFFPEETAQIKSFLEDRLGQQVRYLINTHYHADHTQGTFLFPEAQIIGHKQCRELLHTTGRTGLEKAQQNLPELTDVRIILPDLVFEDGILQVYLGGKVLQLHHMPGHSLDLIGVMVVENEIFFASDNAMPVPTFFDGSYDALVHSLKRTLELKPDAVVQGHGEVILRGEVANVIEDDLAYLQRIHDLVSDVVAAGKPATALDEYDIERCGKSRIPLNGLVADLHQANLRHLYHALQAAEADAPEPV